MLIIRLSNKSPKLSVDCEKEGYGQIHPIDLSYREELNSLSVQYVPANYPHFLIQSSKVMILEGLHKLQTKKPWVILIVFNFSLLYIKNGGTDGTRTRDLRRDRPAF